ncbi:MAG: hypothetical protein DI537_14560 [Stutzerimonas stutzeri]|nr:MAG: hypothetical protein DI537_14560 [Stutzerimonas stutzeri]
MNSRRITADNPSGLMQDRHSQLKHIAGLIQKLSYRDMSRLAHLLNTEWVNEDEDSDAGMAAVILKTTDKILAPEFQS